MSTTLMAIYRDPDHAAGRESAFLRRYAAEHLPLIRAVPGLRSVHAARVSEGWGSDIVLACRMVFADRATLDAALASEEMRAARRNINDLAPIPPEMVVMDPDPELGSIEAAEE
jgi:uncharacterized protein (TIGR02118 family)